MAEKGGLKLMTRVSPLNAKYKVKAQQLATKTGSNRERRAIKIGKTANQGSAGITGGTPETQD